MNEGKRREGMRGEEEKRGEENKTEEKGRGEEGKEDKRREEKKRVCEQKQRGIGTAERGVYPREWKKHREEILEYYNIYIYHKVLEDYDMYIIIFQNFFFL
jgi:hypothetical protein